MSVCVDVVYTQQQQSTRGTKGGEKNKEEEEEKRREKKMEREEKSKREEEEMKLGCDRAWLAGASLAETWEVLHGATAKVLL